MTGCTPGEFGNSGSLRRMLFELGHVPAKQCEAQNVTFCVNLRNTRMGKCYLNVSVM